MLTKTSRRHNTVRPRFYVSAGYRMRGTRAAYREQDLQFRRRGAINIVTRVAAMSSTGTIRTLDFNFNLKSLRPTAGTTYDQ